MTDDLVPVCDRCLRASCWQMIFPCEDARWADLAIRERRELEALGLEHERFWTGD